MSTTRSRSRASGAAWAGPWGISPVRYVVTSVNNVCLHEMVIGRKEKPRR